MHKTILPLVVFNLAIAMTGVHATEAAADRQVRDACFSAFATAVERIDVQLRTVSDIADSELLDDAKLKANPKATDLMGQRSVIQKMLARDNMCAPGKHPVAYWTCVEHRVHDGDDIGQAQGRCLSLAPNFEAHAPARGNTATGAGK